MKVSVPNLGHARAKNPYGGWEEAVVPDFEHLSKAFWAWTLAIQGHWVTRSGDPAIQHH